APPRPRRRLLRPRAGRRLPEERPRCAVFSRLSGRRGRRHAGARCRARRGGAKVSFDPHAASRDRLEAARGPRRFCSRRGRGAGRLDPGRQLRADGRPRGAREARRRRGGLLAPAGARRRVLSRSSRSGLRRCPVELARRRRRRGRRARGSRFLRRAPRGKDPRVRARALRTPPALVRCGDSRRSLRTGGGAGGAVAGSSRPGLASAGRTPAPTADAGAAPATSSAAAVAAAAPALPQAPLVSLPDGAEIPVLLSRVDARYPEAARRLNLSGDGVLRIVIEANGSVGRIDVMTPGPAGMTEAAVDAVRRWTYRPARIAGQQVAVWKVVRIRFVRTVGREAPPD